MPAPDWTEVGSVQPCEFCLYKQLTNNLWPFPGNPRYGSGQCPLSWPVFNKLSFKFGSKKVLFNKCSNTGGDSQPSLELRDYLSGLQKWKLFKICGKFWEDSLQFLDAQGHVLIYVICSICGRNPVTLTTWKIMSLIIPAKCLEVQTSLLWP